MNKEELSALTNFEVNLDGVGISLLSKNSRFTIFHRGYHFPCLYQPSNTSSKKLIVLLSAGGRKKDGKIEFHRWSFPQRYAVLNVEDPMYQLFPNLTSAWYYGDTEHFLCEYLAEIILKIIETLGISCHDVIFVGSSAAGHASMLLASKLPKSACIAMNPQIIIKNWGAVAEKFAKTVKLDLTEDDERNDLTSSCLHSQSRFLITVNSNSTRDWDSQVKILYDKCFENPPDKSGFYSYQKRIEFLICSEKLKYPHSCFLGKGGLYQAIDYLFGDLSSEALWRVFRNEIDTWKMSEDVFFSNLWTQSLSQIPLGYYSLFKINKSACQLKKVDSEKSIVLVFKKANKTMEIRSDDDLLISLFEKHRTLGLEKVSDKTYRIRADLFHDFFKDCMERHFRASLTRKEPV